MKEFVSGFRGIEEMVEAPLRKVLIGEASNRTGKVCRKMVHYEDRSRWKRGNADLLMASRKSYLMFERSRVLLVTRVNKDRQVKYV